MRIAKGAPVAFLVFSALIISGCGTEERPPYHHLLRVESDPGRAVPGASVSFLGRTLGQTGDDGMLQLAIRGAEGDRVAVAVSCPEGYLSPSKALDIVLHRLAEPQREPESTVRCPPDRQRMVVVVRAEHGANLPVLYLGREIARTDESGVAHALVRAPANEEVEITLSTAVPGGESLRPQNPTMRFTSTRPDDIKIFDVQFALQPDKRPPGRRLPVRLN
jgi:hypothetical protein